MAKTFYPGQADYIDRLNDLADAQVGAISADWNATSGITQVRNKPPISTLGAGIRVPGAVVAGPDRGSSAITPGLFGNGTGEYQVHRMGIGSTDGMNYAGFFTFAASAYHGSVATLGGYRLAVRAYDEGSNNYSPELLAINGTGAVYVKRLSAGANTEASYHVIDLPGIAEGSDIASFGAVGVRRALGSYGNLAQNAALIVATNTVSGRSMICGGTVNTGGTDYAEYLIKSLLCGTLLPGQIVGIDADGRLTDKWDRAIAFMVKSTNPSFVGGDTWAQSIGTRPPEPVRLDAATDADWAATLVAHAAAVAAFDIELEAVRQTVDRIAFSGQVPVNVMGATPGQFIVPVLDGEGIAGVAVGEEDMTLKQFMRALGRVIAIEDDGRARIIVRAA